jgi:hypothetical protein
MTDAKESKRIILHQWDKSVEALSNAKTVAEIATALVFMFEALKPLIERTTVTDEELQKHADLCAARSLVTGNARPALVAAINQFPWLGIFGLIGYVLFQIVKHFNGA